MKKGKRMLAWFLAMFLLMANIDYVHAANIVSQGDVAETTISQGDISVGDVSTSEGEEQISASTTILYSGEESGVTWQITSDNELIISGEMEEGATDFDRPEWLEYNAYIKKVTVDAKNVTSTVYWFDGCNAYEYDLTKFDTSKVTNMSCMFRNCIMLSLDVSGFDTGNVTDMTAMFSGCQWLSALDVSGFNTSKVTNMCDMFSSCSSLTSLDVSGFDTGNVTNMRHMFEDCTELKALDVSKFDTSKVTNMRSMFDGCYRLTVLDVSGFDTSKVTYMDSMFCGCSGLTELDVSGFDTSNVTSMGLMFAWCESLQFLDLSGFDMAKVSDVYIMVSYCNYIRKIKTMPELQLEIELPISKMYANGAEYTTFPMNLNRGIYLYRNPGVYTVSFDTGTGNVIDVTDVSAGNIVPLPTDPIREGYRFEGWYTQQEGGGIHFNEETVVNEDYYLHAFWEPVELTALTFAQDSYELREGKNHKILPTYTPTEAAICWPLQWSSSEETVASVESDGTVTAHQKGTTIITAKAANGVFAQYILEVVRPPRSVTFDSGLGEEPLIITGVEAGSTISLPDNPVRENYIFQGWYTQRDGKGLQFTAQTPVEEDLYLYAHWVPDGLWVEEIAPQVYTGKAIKPAVKVYDGEECLREKIDYTVSYKNNIKANDTSDEKKAPTILIKGKGNYKDRETLTFQIVQKNIDDEDITVKEMVAVAGNKVQKPVPTLTYNGKKLKNKTDFTVSYPDLENPDIKDAYKAPGTYTVRVEGKGNFQGTCDITFTITGGTLMSKTQIASISKQAYTGSAIEPEVKVTYKGKTLLKDTDYTVTYKNNTEVGKATVIVTGMGDYAGTKEATFQITGISIAKAKVNGIVNKVYNGMEQTQELEVVLGGEKLAPSNYTVTYSKNVNVGKATVVITGTGNYTGTIKKTFKITAYDIKADTDKLVSGIVENLTATYTKGGSTPALDLSFAGTELVAKKDYTLSYSNNKKLASATDKKAPTIKIKGKGNFKGTITVPFNIVAKDLQDAENPVTINVPDVAYAAKAGKYVSKPVLTDSNGKKLVAGTDYEKTVVYTLADGTELNKKKDAPEVGTVIKVTVKGKGNYTGTLETTYVITQASFKSAKIKIDAQEYTGSAVTLDPEDITVKMGKTELKYGEDYVIVEDSYKNNVKKGTASVTIKGVGNYGGEKTVKFKIASKKFVWFWNLF